MDCLLKLSFKAKKKNSTQLQRKKSINKPKFNNFIILNTCLIIFIKNINFLYNKLKFI